MQNQRPHPEAKSAASADRGTASRRLRVVPVAPPGAAQPLAAGAHNLPTRLPDFVGRADEIEAVEDLLLSSRLVTVTGLSGMGKTRLAVEVATRVHDAYPNGAWLMELAPCAHAHLVPQAVASALGFIPNRVGIPPTPLSPTSPTPNRY